MTRRTAFRYLPLQAVLSIMALLAVACGASTTSISAEVDVNPPVSPAVAGGHQYGTSIDDWVETPADPAQESAAALADADLDADVDADDGTDPNESGAATVAWNDLIPPGFSGQEIVDQFEARFEEIEPGSDEAGALYDEMMAAFDPEAVNLELDGQRIRLAGFVAPLTYEDELVTEFLLVPTYGACIHVPPPPPNQTIMVTVDSSNALTTDEAWGAVWVEGTIVVEASETDLASASYTITNATSGVYSDF